MSLDAQTPPRPIPKIRDGSTVPGIKPTGVGNVEVQDIPNLGRLQVGMVDGVAYTIPIVMEVTSFSGGSRKAQADGKFVAVTLIAKNTTADTHKLTIALMVLLDSAGHEYQLSPKGQTCLYEPNGDLSPQTSVEVMAGEEKDIQLIFDTPTDAGGFKLKIPNGTLSRDAAITIAAPPSTGRITHMPWPATETPGVRLVAGADVEVNAG